MAWNVEGTDEFSDWFSALDEAAQDDVTAIVELLEDKGPQLPYPFSSGIVTSKHSHMRELRIQHAGEPFRVLYAFDPRRTAILLLGGVKAGDDRWYDVHVPIADRLYDEYLDELREEGVL